MKSDIIEFLYKIDTRKKVLLISHNDADGITSGYIMYSILKKLGHDVDWKAMTYLTERGVQKYLNTDRPVIFIDMGAAYGEYVKKYKKSPVAVIDHHPVRGSISSVDAYWVPVSEGETTETIKYATASTLAQAIAVELGLDDKYTAWMAILGSTGDMADLQGYFDEDSLIYELIKKAIDDGYVREEVGLRIPGKFAFDAYELIDFSVLPPTVGEYEHLKGKKPGELTRDDLEPVYGKYTDMVWNKRYIFNFPDPEFMENHDAAMALTNARKIPTDIVPEIKNLGLHPGVFSGAQERLREKYFKLRSALDEIKRKNLYFITEKLIIAYNPDPKNVSNGTLANYIANKTVFGHPERPVIVYSKDPNNGKYIASARIHLEYQGTVDLGALMEEAVGGINGATGGGHPVAAGATIPETHIDDFITRLLTM